MRSTPLWTLVSLCSFAEHRFIIAQLTFDSATTVLENFSLRRGSPGEVTVEPGDGWHTTNEENDSLQSLGLSTCLPGRVDMNSISAVI